MQLGSRAQGTQGSRAGELSVVDLSECLQPLVVLERRGPHSCSIRICAYQLLSLPLV